MKYLLVALISVCTISCVKKIEKPVPPEVSGAVAVRLQMTGDIITSESSLPYGRVAGGVNEQAKTLYDSTIYAVMVYNHPGYNIFSSGLFNQRDSIQLLLPKSGEFRLSVHAMKKGTGMGLYYEMQGTEQFFPNPLQTVANNKMDSLHRTIYTQMWDTLSWIRVVDPAKPWAYLPGNDLPEIDAYYGRTVLSTASLPATISLPMRRAVFGVQLSATNFTSGRLLLEFPQQYGPVAKTVTPANINTTQFIYAADHLKHPDGNARRLPVRLKWEKPDGSIVVLGEKDVDFKRNYLTKLAVTIPGPGRISTHTDITITNSPLSH